MANAYTIDALEFSYEQERTLSIGQLSIAAHSVTALLGPNGSGKSTLLDILAFVKRPRFSAFEFFDKSVEGSDFNVLRRQIGYVQQKPYLFNTSVEKNIELGLKLRGVNQNQRRERTEVSIENLEIQHLCSRPAHNLSGGEIQKVAIARALAVDPKVLLLDEPFTHLDTASKAELEALLTKLSVELGKTVVFSTHDKVQAKTLAKQVYQLESGQLREADSLNTFRGTVDAKLSTFVGEKITIHIPETIAQGDKIAIDPAHLVLSTEKLKSSMRNQFFGKVVSLQERDSEIHLTLEAEEVWEVRISRGALKELGITIGDSLWLSFKSSAVRVF